MRVTAIVLGAGSAGAEPVAGVQPAFEPVPDAEWLWLLEDVSPEPGALAALAAAAERAPDAVLLAPRLLEPDGRLRFVREWPDYSDPTAIAQAAERRLLPLRGASTRGVLVAARAIERFGLPVQSSPSWRPDWEWSARILRKETGYLVPAAAVRLAPGVAEPDPETNFRNRTWTARGPAWTPRERLDRHVQLLVDAALHPQRRAALRGVATGLRRRPR